jgi:protein O-mannosyl-transferase
MSRSKASSPTHARSPKRPNPKRSSGSTPFFAGKSLNTALCILLGAVTIAIYSPVSGHPFVVLDDREYVTANAHIRGLGWDNIKWAFTSTAAANWHPLTWLSHALDYRLFALNPVGHHLDSVLIHALNAVLIFLGLTWITKRVKPSFLVAALFALHPINVESVAWIAERKNVLSTLFFLLAIGAYAWYAQKPGWRRYLLMAALFAAGLMAKPMVVTLPFVLLLLDYWPLERMSFDGTHSEASSSGAQPATLSRLVLEKIPLLALSVASSWITLIAQRTVVRAFDEFSLANRIQNAVIAYGLYLWKMVWPARLAFYPHAIVALPAWQWLLSAAVLVNITAFVIIFRRKRYLPVGWFWFLGTLIPVIGLVQVGEYAMADRYAYVPLIGIFVMIAWGLADLAEAKHVHALWYAIPAICALAALGTVTVTQIRYWESDYDLYSHTLALAESPFAHNAVGMALMNPSSEMTQQDLESFASEPVRIDEARRHFERAVELRQSQENQDSSLWDKARTFNNLGNLDRMQNRLDEAREHDEAALKIYRQLAQENPDAYLPYLAVTLNNLGAIERLQNHLDQARKDYEESLKINRQLAQQDPAKYLPNIAMILNEYGLLDASQNQIEAGREHYEEALKIDRQLAEQSPDVYLSQLAMTLSNFALFDAFQQRMDEARQHYEEALKIDRQLAGQNPAVYLPDLAMTLSNLGRVDQLQGRIDESRAHYEEALSILQKLVQANSKYAGEMDRIEASLKDLGKISPSQP